MRMRSRALASLFLGVAIVLTGLSGPALAGTNTNTATVKVKYKHDSRAHAVLKHAKKLKGKAYRYGGAGPRSFDCSGYVQYVYKKAGKKIGRTSGAQLSAGKSVPKSKKKPGDIMIFMRGKTAYHSAIYAGGGKMWEAQRTGVPVGKHSIWSSGYVVRRPAGNVATKISTATAKMATATAR
ncbi:C40 family peptidase [Aeromicrobium wangtongii]|uniref:NlpC/P60 family protein n=1 Tax=Aeromicrobium wangtongii TaxID=2969247 RepID=A0ABY5M8P2_9ACTN|nr:NlpC/P60 family protein [Aeromicrobium wangtongii]MCD9197008.1 NlpC/P60 family protein [Aeromicrobium wangtongii]UUP14509.1 NlpC/P60 family protein [Aeromicrobium wangtongii]